MPNFDKQTLVIKAYDSALSAVTEVIHDRPQLVDDGRLQPWIFALGSMRYLAQSATVSMLEVAMSLDCLDIIHEWAAAQLQQADVA